MYDKSSTLSRGKRPHKPVIREIAPKSTGIQPLPKRQGQVLQTPDIEAAVQRAVRDTLLKFLLCGVVIALIVAGILAAKADLDRQVDAIVNHINYRACLEVGYSVAYCERERGQ